MKLLFNFCTVIVLTLLSKFVIAQSDTANITGTWQLITSKGSINNIPINHDSSGVYMLKVLTPGLFINTVYDRQTNHFESTVQGTYLAANNIYSETVTNSSVGDFPGHSFTYSYNITGNILTIQGESNGIKLHETWKRVE